jgi:predicted TIM-barrel fold metal-dependent hydrolase
MQVDDMILISTDDHVIEPPGMFEGRVPAKYVDQAPRSIRKQDGSDVWCFDAKEQPTIALNAVVGKTPEEYGWEPTSYDLIRKGCFDIDERIADMDRNGVLASMCFPSFVQFCGQLFQKASDKDVAAVMVRAYNDWHIEEWCASYPGRFIPLPILPIWDPALMAWEVARVAGMGCHAVTFSEDPSALGLPNLHDEHWDPFYRACLDHDVIPCLHIGSSSRLVMPEGAPIDVSLSLIALNAVQTFTNILFSPVLKRFPDMRFVLSEGGIGWIPSAMERVDDVYKRHRFWTGQDFGDRLPSERAREVFTFCFVEDKAGIRDRATIGVGNITWECDYPHSASTWPGSPESLVEQLVGVPDDEIDRMTHGNAMERFRFDPFGCLPREECTVGALRGAAAGRDLAGTAAGHPTAAPRADPPVRLGLSDDIMEGVRS